MNTRRTLLLMASHGAVGAVGFAAGIYTLPILIAPAPPDAQAHAEAAAQAMFTGTFRRDLPGSDRLHWGDGEVTVGREAVALQGRLSPGPDFKLYFAPEFVDTAAAFERLKPRMQRAGDIRTFQDFIVPVPSHIDPAAFNTVVVWCERFSAFITAAQYR